MTPEELYEFDIRGYRIVRGALPSQEVAELNHLVDEGLKGDRPMSFDQLLLGPAFMELMARVETLKMLTHLLGQWFRFDHGFGLQMSREMKVNENLHGAPRDHQGADQYHWVQGRPYNGLVVVMYPLTTAVEGDGGFICVPGSHRASIDYRPPVDSPLVVNPTLNAGDMLVFTEALNHGSRQWTAPYPRRALVYKYSPGYSASSRWDLLEPYQALAATELQRELLRPPYVGLRTRLSLPRS